MYRLPRNSFEFNTDPNKGIDYILSAIRALQSGGGGGGGVTSFNTRTGAVTLTSGDVTTALGYTPLSSVPTLDQVTTAGNTTTNSITVGALSKVLRTGNSNHYSIFKIENIDSVGGTFGFNFATYSDGGSNRILELGGYNTTSNAFTGVWTFNSRPVFASGIQNNYWSNFDIVHINSNAGQAIRFISLGPSGSGGTIVSFVNNGNVLIGTTTDAGYKLDVNGTARITNLGVGAGVSTNNITGDNIAQFGNAVSSGDQYVVIDSISGSKRGIKFGNQGTIRMALVQNVADLQIGNYANPSSFFPYVTFVYASGNVGIGTSSPSVKLEVVDPVPNGAQARFTYNQDYFLDVGYNRVVSRLSGTQDFRIGTINSFPMSLITNNLQRITITTTGNVLIGTTTDAGYKLDVNGSARVVGDLSIVNGLITFSNPGGNRTMTTSGLTINYGSTYGFSITGTNTASITPIADLTLKGVYHTQVSTEVYKVQKTTNVGHLQINFDIVGSDATAYNYGTKSGNVRIYPGAETNGNGYGNVILGHDGTNSRGNVGIGTSSPEGPLHVKYSSSTVPGITIENDGVGYNAGSMTLRSGTTGGVNMSVTSGGGLYWYNLSTTTNTLSLPSTGNLIVGSAVDAGYRLDVQGGDARFAQNVEAASYSVAGNAGYSGIINFPSNPPGFQNLEYLQGILINVF